MCLVISRALPYVLLSRVDFTCILSPQQTVTANLTDLSELCECFWQVINPAGGSETLPGASHTGDHHLTVRMRKQRLRKVTQPTQGPQGG